MNNTFKKSNRETLLKKDYCGDLLKLKNSMKWYSQFFKIRNVSISLSMHSLKNTLKKTNRDILTKKDYCRDLLKLKNSLKGYNQFLIKI